MKRLIDISHYNIIMEKIRYEKPVIKQLNAGLLNKFGTKTEYVPLTEIEGIPVKKLLVDFGSPLFVISEKKIRKNYQDAVRAFKTRYPRVQFAWSYKTNYLSAVCNIFHQEGSWAEVVSGYEYQRAVKNGVPGNKIIFNGPYKSDAELHMAVENGSILHIDHMDELYAVMQLAGKSARKPQVGIRVNMDTGIYPTWDRFGFNYETGQAWNAITRLASSDKIHLTGLHSHIGTFIISPKAYATAVYKLTDLALGLKAKYGKTIKYIDIGGGFASTNTLKGAYLPGTDSSPSIDDFAESITGALHTSGFKKEDMPLLILETGRALIDDAAYLLGTVVAVKRLADGRRAIVLDIGVNLLFTSFWYDHKISPTQEFGQYSEDMVVYGPLCMNIDVIRESVNLPVLKKGDHVVIHRVGAYNMTQWLQFITLRPAVVLIGGDSSVHMVREKETLDYLTAPERLPPHLKEFSL